jgi:hypothetical protein
VSRDGETVHGNRENVRRTDRDRIDMIGELQIRIRECRGTSVSHHERQHA